MSIEVSSKDVAEGIVAAKAMIAACAKNGRVSQRVVLGAIAALMVTAARAIDEPDIELLASELGKLAKGLSDTYSPTLWSGGVIGVSDQVGARGCKHQSPLTFEGPPGLWSLWCRQCGAVSVQEKKGREEWILPKAK